jgi:hypothetical protein
MQMEDAMADYQVKKRRGRWIVCSPASVMLNFNSYDDALKSARHAAPPRSAEIIPFPVRDRRWARRIGDTRN